MLALITPCRSRLLIVIKAARRLITRCCNRIGHNRAQLGTSPYLTTLNSITCLVHHLPQRQLSIDLVDHVLVDLVVLHQIVQTCGPRLLHLTFDRSRVTSLVGLGESNTSCRLTWLYPDIIRNPRQLRHYLASFTSLVIHYQAAQSCRSVGVVSVGG